jgi:hypothetical protein
MQPKERRETGEQDLFRSRLDQIIDLQHALVRLARTIDWRFLEEKFGAVYTDKPGHPPLPTRLMAGLAGYEDVNDADRLGRDPAMRWIVAGRAASKQAASTSQMGRFETEWLADHETLSRSPILAGDGLTGCIAAARRTASLSLSET